MLFAKGRSIRGTRRYMRRTARITARERIAMSRVQQRAAVRTARIKGRSTRRTARAERRLGVTTAGFRARQLHRVKSPGGRTHRIYKGRKQKWSKKYGGWVYEKAYRKKAAPEPEEDYAKMIKDLTPLILLMKGVT